MERLPKPVIKETRQVQVARESLGLMERPKDMFLENDDEEHAGNRGILSEGISHVLSCFIDKRKNWKQF